MGLHWASPALAIRMRLFPRSMRCWLTGPKHLLDVPPRHGPVPCVYVSNPKHPFPSATTHQLSISACDEVLVGG